MGTKLERIAEISATTKRPEFTSLYHLINAELLKQCHRELDGKKAVGIDKVTKEEYGKHLERNIADLVQRLRNKSYKPLPTRRVYIPKANGKLRPLGIVSYEDKIVQLAVKKILEAIYEPKFLNCMYGFRLKRGCHEAIKEVYQRVSHGKINYIVDADIKGFFDHIDHEWMMRFLKWHIKDPNILWLVQKYLKAGVMVDEKYEDTDEGTIQGGNISPTLANIGTVHLHEGGFDEETGLAAAAAADDQDVLVPGVLGIFRAAGHGKLFRLSQRDVPVGDRIDIGGNIRRRAPPGAAVLNALAIFLCILALGIHAASFFFKIIYVISI